MRGINADFGNSNDPNVDRVRFCPALKMQLAGMRQNVAAQAPTDSPDVVVSLRLLRNSAAPIIVQGTLAFLARVALATLIFFTALPVSADADDADRYRVEIDAPSSVKGAVEGSLDLVRWQTYAGLTPELLELLIADAKAQAGDAAAAQGYFAAVVSGSLDNTTTPPTVRIRVEPGEPTLVVEVSIEVTGAVIAAPGGADAVAAMQASWLLPRGAVFRQADWIVAKVAAAPTLAASRSHACQLTRS